MMIAPDKWYKDFAIQIQMSVTGPVTATIRRKGSASREDGLIEASSVDEAYSLAKQRIDSIVAASAP